MLGACVKWQNIYRSLRCRPPIGDNKQNKITIIFSEKEQVLYERLNKLASDSDKSVTEILRNILKLALNVMV